MRGDQRAGRGNPLSRARIDQVRTMLPAPLNYAQTNVHRYLAHVGSGTRRVVNEEVARNIKLNRIKLERVLVWCPL